MIGSGLDDTRTARRRTVSVTVIVTVRDLGPAGGPRRPSPSLAGSGASERGDTVSLVMCGQPECEPPQAQC